MTAADVYRADRIRIVTKRDKLKQTLASWIASDEQSIARRNERGLPSSDIAIRLAALRRADPETVTEEAIQKIIQAPFATLLRCDACCQHSAQLWMIHSPVKEDDVGLCSLCIHIIHQQTMQPTQNQSPVHQLQRMWINQPSSAHPDHENHGRNVLVMPSNEDYWDVYPVDAMDSPLVGRVHRSSLSDGWNNRT